MAAPFQHIFYLTPSADTPVGSYQLTLNASNTDGTKHFSAMHVVLNVLACQETFQPGTYTLTAHANQVTGGFGMGPGLMVEHLALDGPDFRAVLQIDCKFLTIGRPENRVMSIRRYR